MKKKEEWICYVKHDLGIVGCFFLNRGKKYITTYENPKLAKRFPTKKEAKAWVDNEFVGSKEVKFTNKVDDLQRQFNNVIAAGVPVRNYSIRNKKLDRKYKGEDKLIVLYWWKKYATKGDEDVSYDNYRSWPNLHQVFECLFSVENYRETKKPFKMFHSVEMRVNKTTRFETFEEEFNLIKDWVNYCDEDGFKVVSIFDKDLSEFESRSFKYKDDKYKITTTSYHDVYIETTSLKEIFDYWKKEFYYGE